jgi:hypothetical protein
MVNKYDIFLSYRRNGGYVTAKHLYDLLSRDGYNVSFDIDTLRNGDFDVELLKRIDECTDFIVILNKDVFVRTLDQSVNIKQDWLRNELAYALEKGKNVIPIMLEGFTEFPENLPADIARVHDRVGFQLAVGENQAQTHAGTEFFGEKHLGIAQFTKAAAGRNDSHAASHIAGNTSLADRAAGRALAFGDCREVRNGFPSVIFDEAAELIGKSRAEQRV